MKIHAFEIRQDGARSVAEVVNTIFARGLADREFAGAPLGMRIEDANTAGNLVLVDFARPRSGHGPGKMARARPLVDIPLEADAMFGEDTAMAYDPATGFAAIQFNPFGPRPTAIQQYLTAADLGFGLLPQANGDFGFTFAPRFRAEAFRRLRDFGLVREIDFTISVAGVNRADFDAGRSVGSILSGPLPGGIQTVSIKMTAGRKRGDSLALDAAFAVLTDLERLGGDLVEGTVKGKRTPEDKTSSIDLVDERLSAEREIRPNRGHRFARPERWAALREALVEWRAAGQLQ
jgi:hypothetical protein